jgi:hypothetical protein
MLNIKPQGAGEKTRPGLCREHEIDVDFMMTAMDAPCLIHKQYFPGKKFHTLNALLIHVRSFRT